MKATKTWRDMLNESLEDPNFREEWEDANAELAELDKIIAARASAGLTRRAVKPRCSRRGYKAPARSADRCL